MPFRLPFGKEFIECDTPEEALRLARTLGLDQLGAAQTLEVEGEGEFLPGNRLPHCGPWTDVKLDTFLQRLGPDQKAILRILVVQTRVTADELRAAVKVDGNQALAGIISGISKQAVALGIGARDVFVIENRRRLGVLSKSFSVAADL